MARKKGLTRDEIELFYEKSGLSERVKRGDEEAKDLINVMDTRYDGLTIAEQSERLGMSERTISRKIAELKSLYKEFQEYITMFPKDNMKFPKINNNAKFEMENREDVCGYYEQDEIINDLIKDIKHRKMEDLSNKLKINMYVRTSGGYVAKIKDIRKLNNDIEYVFISNINNEQNNNTIRLSNLLFLDIYCSDDIFDLIYVGDYINGKEINEEDIEYFKARPKELNVLCTRERKRYCLFRDDIFVKYEN